MHSQAAGTLSWLGLAAYFSVILTGCNGNGSSKTIASQTTNAPQLYLAAGVGNLQTYLIDHSADQFIVTSYSTNGGTVQDSGNISQLSSGLFDLDITYFPGEFLSGPPLTASWEVEIPGQAALAELEATDAVQTSTSFAPLVPIQSCPSITTSESFQFVTIPKRLNTLSSVNGAGWNPQLETAYGSADVVTNGSAVQFSNISQHTLPAVNGGAPGTPVNPASGSTTGACSPTFFGETISVPSAVTIVNPGSSNPESISPSATIGIGPGGFLLEDSGSSKGSGNGSGTPYENVLGAGYGAIGIVVPSSALTTSNVTAAQYQGILYGAASGSTASLSSSGFRLIGSFGYPNLETACPALPAPSDSTIIYGGEFANNDPSANSHGNCDLAIDLGTQDSSNNGLYPAATVYVSASFPYNSIGTSYSFPAVAVAGQIDEKYAIFLIGMDTAGSQPWGIYLLQSN
jgi:hypothetical protein